MAGQKTVTPTAERLANAAGAEKPGNLPPVHLWDPPLSGEMDMRIARDGTWYHEGRPITRFELARLFSTILKLEDGRYVLVTPVEKVAITVDDAPFVAVDFAVAGEGREQVLTFETNMKDHTVAGRDNPIRVERDPQTGEPSPYVHVRAGLEALIDRKSFYRLVDIGMHHEGWFGLWSGGDFFPIIPSEELP